MVSTYARDIYLFGNRTFAQIPEPYVEPVKEYAAETYRQDQLDNALEKGWITQEEYDDTMAYKTSA
nr:XkdX family protein [Brevibacillus borstelensis]